MLWLYYTIPSASACFGRLGNNFSTFVWLRITDEGSVSEMRIWSILLIKSDIKWYMDLCVFQLFGERRYWWTRESQSVHVANFYGRLWLIRSI